MISKGSHTHDSSSTTFKSILILLVRQQNRKNTKWGEYFHKALYPSARAQKVKCGEAKRETHTITATLNIDLSNSNCSSVIETSKNNPKSVVIVPISYSVDLLQGCG